MIKVRHSTFKDSTGVAIRATTKKDQTSGVYYPATEVRWDRFHLLDTIMANYNLIFIVPAPSRRVPSNEPT